MYRKLIVVAAMAIFAGCRSAELSRVRNMPIQDVDVKHIADGVYDGQFSYCGFVYRTRTTVKSGHITDVSVLHNRNTTHARKAEKVIQSVLDKQTPNVDAVTGATTTSKALLKAIESSLTRP